MALYTVNNMESLRNSVTLLKNFHIRFVVSKLCMPRFAQEKETCLWLPNPFVSVERMQILVIEIDSALWPFGNYLNGQEQYHREYSASLLGGSGHLRQLRDSSKNRKQCETDNS